MKKVNLKAAVFELGNGVRIMATENEIGMLSMYGQVNPEDWLFLGREHGKLEEVTEKDIMTAYTSTIDYIKGATTKLEEYLHEYNNI